MRYNGNISSMRWQNGTSAAKSGYKFSYETVVDYASLPYVVAGYYYYVKDHLGNVRVVLNENGNVEQKTNYYAFGGVFCTNIDGYNKGQDLQPYKYNGKELDRTTMAHETMMLLSASLQQ